MPRRARITATELPHHITQRGNFQQVVFESDIDKENYLTWIQEYAGKYKISILNYCLMPNHVHFIVIPHNGDSLSRTFNAAHMRYAQYVNRKMQRNGHLWQGRFYSCILDEPHLVRAARYIERNPVTAGLVKKPWHWSWSSAQANTGKGGSHIRLAGFLNLVGMTCVEWKEYIVDKETDEIADQIKKHTFTGRPLGSPQFIIRLEEKMGKKFALLTRGRPRKNENR